MFVELNIGINKSYNIANFSKPGNCCFDTSIPQKTVLCAYFYSFPSSVRVNMQTTIDCVAPPLSS